MENLEVINKTEEEVCLFCGFDEVKMETSQEMQCVFCGEISDAMSICVNNHYVCDNCKRLTPNELIKKVCMNTKKTDPISLAVEIMGSPAIKMHGPEHHFIVPAVLLTCINNAFGSIENLKEKIDMAEKRANETVPTCSFNLGTCGAAIGTGIFLSIYTNQNPRSEDEWSLANSIIASSLKRVADSGGPRCCKRDTYIAIEEAVDFLRDKFAVYLPISTAKCTFSLRNRSCGREECNFYNLSFSLV